MDDTTSRVELRSAAFVGVAPEDLVAGEDVVGLLDRLVGQGIMRFAADAVGVVLTDETGMLQVAAASDEHADLMELLQLHADEGPTVDCVRCAAPVGVPDIADVGGRWPVLVAAMTTRPPYRSVHALPLRLHSTAIGALTLFGRQPGPLPDADLALAQALSDLATVAILQERALRRAEVVNAQLRTALSSRVIIEQAKGVLAQHGGLSMGAAFERLRSYSRTRNERLSHVARRVVEGGLEPGALGVPGEGA